MGAYKEAAKMATDALMKMMKTADNETLAVVWEFNKGSIIANTSMPLMDDDLNPADVKTKLETFDLSCIPDLAEISAEESPGNTGNVLQSISIIGYVFGIMLPFILL